MPKISRLHREDAIMNFNFPCPNHFTAAEVQSRDSNVETVIVLKFLKNASERTFLSKKALTGVLD